MPRTISIDTTAARIAFVTDDGTSISPHFGRAMYYEVVTLSNGSVVNRERREKVGHHTFHAHHNHGEHNSSSHDEHDAKHRAMTDPIADCSLLVARGMGTGAHNHLTTAQITPVITACKTIDEALASIARGRLDDNPERLH